MGQVGNIARTATDLGALVHENYINEVKPWLDHMSGVGQVFGKRGAGPYSLIGEKLVFAAKVNTRQPAMATGGYLPYAHRTTPVNLETTPTRIYERAAIDNFAEQIGKQPGAFEDHMASLMEDFWDGFERAETRHVHGGSSGVVCLANAARSGAGTDQLVVKDGYGIAGAAPTMFLDKGMWVAVLDASASDAVLGAYTISSIDHDTSATTATITFTTSISATIAAGDKLVFCTHTTTGDTNFETEDDKAPLGLVDLLDPGSTATSYLGVTLSSEPRANRIAQASADWGMIEIQEFLAKIEAKGQTQVTPESHVLTMQKGLEIELAKTLLPFQQQNNLGGTLEGGYRTVNIAGHSFVLDSYHIPGVMYAICLEDFHVVDLDGDPDVVALDGSAWSRLPDYDGREMYAKHYVQRFASRRNRSGALTGISNPNHQRYDARPE
jgi:hypothetical protein